MVGLADYIRFENEIQELFERALERLNTVDGTDIVWEARRNVRLRRDYEADLVIYKSEKVYAVIDIKSSDRFFRSAKISFRNVVYQLGSPYYFIVCPRIFGYFYADGGVIKIQGSGITEEDIIEILSGEYKQEFDSEKWNKAIDGVKEYVGSIEDKIIKSHIKEIEAALDNLKKSNNYRVGDGAYRVIIDKSAEDALFNALLGRYTKDKAVRFTTLNSIFRSINTASQSMCSIVAMNDKSETSYVNDYYRRIDETLCSHVLSGTKDWNNSFITSCCDKDRENDFTMLRLYADDAKGVCIRYKVDEISNYPGFIFRPVSYQRGDGSHPELDILAQLLQINIGGYTMSLPNFSVWQHFFKPKEYEFEKEVRLLYRDTGEERKGIKSEIWVLNEEYNVITPIITFSIKNSDNAYPLIIETINLGPKMREADINKEQIEYLVKRNDIANGVNIVSVVSSISHYR